MGGGEHRESDRYGGGRININKTIEEDSGDKWWRIKTVGQAVVVVEWNFLRQWMTTIEGGGGGS